jgi:hypothetical protein
MPQTLGEQHLWHGGSASLTAPTLFHETLSSSSGRPVRPPSLPERSGYLGVLLPVRFVVSVVPMLPVPEAPPVVIAPPIFVESVVVVVTFVESVVLAVFLLHAVIAAPAAKARTKSRVDFIIVMLVLPP